MSGVNSQSGQYGGYIPPQAIVASIPASPPKPRRKRAKRQAKAADDALRPLPPMISPMLTLNHAPSTCDAGIIEGRELKRMRKKMGLSQGELGADLGLTDRTISKYETDVRSVPLELYNTLYTMLQPQHPTAIAIIDAKTLAVIRVI